MLLDVASQIMKCCNEKPLRARRVQLTVSIALALTVHLHPANICQYGAILSRNAVRHLLGPHVIIGGSRICHYLRHLPSVQLQDQIPCHSHYISTTSLYLKKTNFNATQTRILHVHASTSPWLVRHVGFIRLMLASATST